MKSLQQKPAVRAHKATYFTSVRPRASAARHHQQQQARSGSTAAACGNTRRSLLAGLGVSIAGLSFLRPLPAAANPLEDIARQITRPADITPLDAAVALLDARATLRDMSPLVESAPDSRERFVGRKLWPAYAKWLRPVGPSAPVAAAIISGIDTEATLSAEYGGTGGSNAAVDAVYVALGRVLTISGRTIKDEAQFDPALIKSAEVAIDEVISQLPKQLVEEAQQFRVARAGGKA